MAYVVLGVKRQECEERCALLCLGRTLAGRGGPSREGGTVRWAASMSSGRSQSGGGRRRPPCAPMPELGMKMRGAKRELMDVWPRGVVVFVMKLVVELVLSWLVAVVAVVVVVVV